MLFKLAFTVTAIHYILTGPIRWLWQACGYCDAASAVAWKKRVKGERRWTPRR